ncbi:S26 family signal peptidase [Hyphomonas sp. GM-8P]|uniref:S26 family signal peptidase n=1 Tax=Hyphomonas sp. GM-8P TaxID=1280945 RepID=UPI000DC0539A|nr:S26 family signal peptidase [Hyphomonas sp. GM-8P]MBO6690023.1 S26 family signal peptidase [Henriciella sp.]MBO6696967.1 S26 family signal peptidase [Henriciella sp.]RAN37777.1 hypothetical protein HY26_18465 [Hyphomonas sp. GM-8P]|tara:strand:- start:113 stop:619 length:507 start_codon:yes stop_codon:yes gene_type:complete
MRRRKGLVCITVIGVGLVAFGAVFNPSDRLIWNRTASAPEGLYWLSDAPFAHGRWVVVSASAHEAQWAEAHGFVGRDWPLLKQISGTPSDEVCREGVRIQINGLEVGAAHIEDRLGQNLPVWSGCILLQDGQYFLMNDHPDSLDGRYFGPTDAAHLDGVATLVVTWGH